MECTSHCECVGWVVVAGMRVLAHGRISVLAGQRERVGLSKEAACQRVSASHLQPPLMTSHLCLRPFPHHTPSHPTGSTTAPAAPLLSSHICLCCPSPQNHTHPSSPTGSTTAPAAPPPKAQPSWPSQSTRSTKEPQTLCMLSSQQTNCWQHYQQSSGAAWHPAASSSVLLRLLSWRRMQEAMPRTSSVM
jgi:hypothetical protein